MIRAEVLSSESRITIKGECESKCGFTSQATFEAWSQTDAERSFLHNAAVAIVEHERLFPQCASKVVFNLFDSNGKNLLFPEGPQG